MARKKDKVVPVEAPAEIELGRLHKSLGFRLRPLMNHLSREFQATTDALGLKTGEFSSLAVIANNPGISQNDLANAIDLDKSGLVAIINDLVRRGWVERHKSSVDLRRSALHATEAGAAQLETLFEALEQVELPALSHLTQIERDVLFNILDRIQPVLRSAL